jgi:hypothetical protein
MVQKPDKSIEHECSKAVQKFNGDFELLGVLPPTAKKILAILGADGVASEAVRTVGCVKSNVTYWKDRFLRGGALTLRCDGVIKYYNLTPFGSKLLTGSDGVVRLPILLEDRPIKYKVLCREQSLIDWRKLGDPKNWRKLGVKIGEVRVILNDRLGSNHTEANLIIHPGQMKGFSSKEVFENSVRVVERTRNILEIKFGMLLDSFGEVVGTPRYHVYRPECHQWIEAGCVEIDGVGGLDASPTHDKQDPLNKQPHLEYADGRLADDAAAFPVSGRGTGLGESAVEFPLVLRELLRKNTVLEHQVADLSAQFKAQSLQFEALASSNRGVSDSVQNLVSLIKGENVSPKSVPGNENLGGKNEYIT